MKKTIFITDSHILAGTGREKYFSRFLELVSETDWDVVFLGDIFDLWFALPGYEKEMHKHFLAWCKREKKVRNLYYIEGNHEFYISNRKSFFTKIIYHEKVLCNGKVLVMHGDQLNRNDFWFFMLRLALRNPFTELLCRIGGLGFGPKLAGKIRADLRGTNMQQKRYFPEKELMEYSKRFQEKGIKHILAGHYHKEAFVGTAVVLAPWTEPEWPVALYQEDTGLQLTTMQKVFQEKWNIASV